MAKKQLKQEDLVLNIIVNGNKAQSEIGKLARAIQDAKSKVSDLEAEQKTLERQGKKNTERYNSLTAEIERQNKVIAESKKRLTEHEQSLKLEEQTIGQLENALRRLRQLRKQTVPGTEQYKRYTQEMQVIEARLVELGVRGQQTGNTLTRLTGTVKSFFGSFVGGAAMIFSIATGIKRARDEFASFDDKLADVKKTTNSTRLEVKALSDELELLDTRTSQEDLLGLGRIGGKLGITDMDELRGFIESSNQLVVALNEDLGGNVEDTVRAVGKLVDIFGVKEIYGMEQGLLKVGSAINELGMASTANEKYMIEFSRRMAGVAPLANISVAEILGLGATLDQFGQTAEVSSTALSRLFLRISKEAENYARYAKMEVNEFKQLLEQDFMSAFIRILEGVKGSSEGINELAATLGDLGLDGGRVIGVVGTLANNTETLRQQMDLANKSFDEGISLTEEYNIKNSTAQAELEKTRKEVTRLWRELGEKLWPAFATGNNLLVMLMRALSTIVGFISDNIRTITTLTVAIVAYTIAVNAATIAARTITIATRIATAAQWLWNAAITANPIGLLVAGITAASAALTLYTRRLSAAEFAQKALTDVTKEANKESNAEVQTIQRLQSILKDNTESIKNKTLAVSELRDIMPDVLQQYTDEEVLLGKATAAVDNHIKALRRHAAVRAAQNKIEELEARKLAIQSGDQGWWTNTFRAARGRLLGPGAAAILNAEEDVKEIENIDNAIDKLFKTIIEGKQEINATKANIIDDALDPVDSKQNQRDIARAQREANKARAAELEVAKKSYQEQLEAEGLFRKDRRTMTAEELEKLLDIEQDYQTKVDEINKKYQHSATNTANVAEAELLRRELAERKYRDNLLSPKSEPLQREEEQHRQRLEQAGLFGKKREELTEEQLSALEKLETMHAYNIGKIDANAMRQAIEDRQKLYQDELTDLRIRNNEELAEIRTLEQAKIKLADSLSPEALRQIKTLNQAKRILQNQHQQEEEQLTRAHLQKLNDLLRSVLDTGEWKGIDLADKILSDDERKVLEGNIRKIREELSKLRNRDLTDEAEDSTRGKTDILGMSMSDWDQLFQNLDNGKLAIQDLMNVWGLASQGWNQYNAYVAAGEKRRFQEYEESNRRQREILENRLKSGAISQEQYNAQVEKLEKDLARKRARMEYEQAKREKAVALISAIVNTAAGVARAFKDFKFPYSAIVAAAVGAAGALQIGTISRQPLPSLSGREEGGYLVRRSQDGKVFNASHDPDRRGYVGKPTVIVGENGNEFVANAQAVANPSVRPILDIIDIAQRNGTISTLQLENILPRANDLRASIPGRQTGGALSEPILHGASPADFSAMSKLLDKATQTMDRLDKTIARGIKAEVALLGKNGFYEKDQEYKDIQNGANL